MINMIIEQWEVRGCPPAAGWGRGRIGNGVRIPDRTAAVMPSDAQYAIGIDPRRPRGAMRLSQKTCLRIAYRIFGLKRDMFLSRARLWGFPRAGGACDAVSFAGYIGLGRNIPLFHALSGKAFVFPMIGALVAERAGAGWYPAAARCGSRLPTGSAVPEGRAATSPWTRPGSGAAGNRKLWKGPSHCKKWR